MVEDIALEDELYAIGFRKGSDATEKMNTIIAEMQQDGSLKALAEKYDLTELYDAALSE